MKNYPDEGKLECSSQKITRFFKDVVLLRKVNKHNLKDFITNLSYISLKK